MSRIASFLISVKARLSAAPFKRAVEDPTAAQAQLLREILERNKDTEYGKGYEFGRLKNIEDYQGNVPIIDYEDIRERIVKQIPLGRMAAMEDISHAVRFVLENDYVSGRTIEVDGALRI